MTSPNMKAIANSQESLTAGDATFALGLLGALVAIAIAITGWKLAHYYRRRDRERTDLTDVAQLLHRIHVQIQVLADQEGVITVLDLLPLKELKSELECICTPSLSDLDSAKVNSTSRLAAYIATAIPEETVVPDMLKRAQQQGRATEDVLAAIREAQAVVQRLRNR
jgi:hypothetical protein